MKGELMKKKFVLPLVMAAGLLTLAACGGTTEDSTDGEKGSSDSVNLTVDWGTTTKSFAEASKQVLDTAGVTSLGEQSLLVWCADKVTDETTGEITDFLAALQTAGVDTSGVSFEVQAVSESDAASQMITDVESGADIYCFAQDQLSRLIGASALSPLYTIFNDTVKKNNDAGSINAVSYSADGGEEFCYAFPLTSDNGYFLYYDKSKISDETVLEDLGDLVTYLKEEGSTLYYDYGNAWYNMGWFYGNGCKSDWTTNDSGKFSAYNDTYDTTAGYDACKAFYDETWGIDADVLVAGSDASTAFGAGAAACVSGTWDYDTCKELLGDNLGATDLPSFTVNGEQKHLASFSGNKLMGVKPQTDTAKAYISYLVANYLSGYVGQMGRFESQGWGPSNLTAQADENATTPALQALALQNAYATLQGQYPNGWWDLAKAIGPDLKSSGGDETAIKTILSNYSSQLDSCLNANGPDWSTTTVSIIGSIASIDPGVGWTCDTDLTPNSGYTSFTKTGVVFAEGDSWKLRLDHAWNTSYGYAAISDEDTLSYVENDSGNIKITVAGTYDVTFLTDGEKITLTPSES